MIGIQEKSFLYETPDSKNYKNIPVVTLNSPKFVLYQEVERIYYFIL